MKSILINRKPVQGPWGGGNLFVASFCEAFRQQGYRVVHAFEPNLDYVFMQDPRPDALGISVNEIAAYKSENPKVKVLHRVNECDARKGTSGLDDFLRECSKITDHTIFVSNWMREYHTSKGWLCPNTSVVYNGVNLEHFKQQPKFCNGKINIVTHHWSDNPLKGADIHQFLDELAGKDDRFTFTYIGRCGYELPNTRIIAPLCGESLGAELGKYDVYVSGSRFDPGPNHIIESLACGLPTYTHIDGGGAAEFAGGSHTYKNTEELIALLLKSSQNSHFSPIPWDRCMRKVQLILEAIK